GAIVLRSEAVFHQAMPDLARGPVFGNLFEKIVVRVEEKAKAWAEIVDVESALSRPLHIFDAIVDGEREFLQRRRAGLANVVAGNRDGVEARSEFRPEFE